MAYSVRKIVLVILHRNLNFKDLDETLPMPDVSVLINILVTIQDVFDITLPEDCIPTDVFWNTPRKLLNLLVKVVKENKN
jgi:hypothetical protein